MELRIGTMSRRGFMQRSLAGLAATGIPAWFARDLVIDAAQTQPPAAPSDRIVMGHIGCGGRGRDNVSAAQRLGAQYVAFCDVDRSHRQDYAMRYNGSATLFEDYRELLARRDINAVSIATPDHWHALVAIAALRAGKDVYCEKPLTLTVNEGKALVRVARHTRQIFQTGSQQRTEFNGRFRLAVELVRNGRLGALQSIECRVEGNPRPNNQPFTVRKPPEGFNFDFWLGPAPTAPYVTQRCHNDFRWWYDYSGGKMTDWGAHHLDVAQWALNMDQSGPVLVEATSEPPDARANCYTCHPHFHVTYRYANGVTVHATSRRVRNDSNQINGVRFDGEDGKWLFVHRGGMTASDPRIISDPLPGNAMRLPNFNNHMRNFIDCVRSRQQPICNYDVGFRSVSVCHLGNIAIRTGLRLRWNPETERFVDNEEANLWLGREMRSPYRLDA